MSNKEKLSQDLAEIRSMMERSTKVHSLSGWVGILLGTYALAGYFIAKFYLKFHPVALYEEHKDSDLHFSNSVQIAVLGLLIIGVAILSTLYFSHRKAYKKNEKFWTPSAKRLIFNLSVPMIAGGILILIFLNQGLTGLLAPTSLLFYGLALINAAHFTYSELRILGFCQVFLGLAGYYFVPHAMEFWATGFGVFHITYGIYMHNKYEK
ncbi:MAG TPA: hypothetical protein PKC30_14330 [Saprospiraceae bacterium]|nr:hypothetical protein [Saprospiraceae bacterium]